jgi:hypothetical protein
MRTTTVAAALVLLTLGISSAKEPLRLNQTYNLFDFGYERTEYRGDVGNALGSGDGFETDLMWSPLDYLLLAAEYHYSKPNNIEKESISTNDLKLGIGGYLPLGTSASLYTHLGGRYLEAHTNIDDYNADEWGLYVEPGVRINLGEKFEIYGAAEYSRILDVNMVNGKAGGVFFITPGFGVEVFGRFGGDWADQYGAGVRFAW